MLGATAQNAYAEPDKEIPLAQKTVLVTGASSGIGRHIAEKLASEGYFVYAGARKAEDLKALSAIANIEGVRLDVTRQNEIDEAVALIRKRGKGLYGLVNNAGVGGVGPLIEFDEAELRFQFEVNVFGPYRVTKAFAPLIIESKGRITTTGSISGFVTGPLYGPYSMGKFAIEAFTDALASEMQRFGVEVSVVEPGTYKSDITRKARERMKASGQTVKGSRYAEDLERMLQAPEDRSNFGEPTAVAEAVLHALADPNPKRRYLVVPNEGQARATVSAAITRAVELNRDQPYSYDRAALIKMLDDALAPASK